jgi:CBS domain-containing protein
MQVRDVLRKKGGRVITIKGEATVNDAVARLVQNNIGSLPVVDAEGRMVGVFSERDVLRLYHSQGESFGSKTVESVMTRHPVVCSADDDVNEVMGIMSERRIAKVPVIDGESLVGVVSVGDVIKVMYECVQDENCHLYNYLHGIA